MMTKNKSTVTIILGILLVVFNVIFFAVPSAKDASFWISYSFGIVSILAQLGICLLAWDKAITMKSKFMGVPLLLVGDSYVILQLLSSFIFLGLAVYAFPTPFYIPLIINTIILGIAIISIVVIDKARDEINRVEEKVKEKVFFIKSLQVDVETLVSSAEDIELKKDLEALADKIKYSDPMSSEKLVTLEGEISAKIVQLKTNLNGELVLEISTLLEERNKKAKLLK